MMTELLLTRLTLVSRRLSPLSCAPCLLYGFSQLNLGSVFTNNAQPSVRSTSITFVSQASIDSGAVASYNLRKRVEAVKACRTVTKRDMKYNDVMPKMKVDPERYVSGTIEN